MTKAYSKISGYDRPHVYVFVSDKKISTLESVSKISGYGRKIRWIRVDASRIRKKKKFALYDDALYAGLKAAC